MTKHRGLKSIVSVFLALLMAFGAVPIESIEALFAGGQNSRRALAEGAVTDFVDEGLTSDDGWIYRLRSDGYAEITGYAGVAPAKLSVPAALGGAWVAGIAQNAFSGVSGLETLTIPSSVSEISPLGVSGVTIRAYNGSAALSYAKSAGLKSANLSEYDFFDDIFDLSDMRSSQFSFQGGGSVRVSEPFSRLMSVGLKVYLPPNNAYKNGFPCEVTAVTRENGYAVLSVSELDFMSAVEHYRAEDVELYPDYDNIIIHEEGFKLLPSSQSRLAFGPIVLSREIGFEVDHELAEGISVVGKFAYTPKISVTLETHWFKLKEYYYEKNENFTVSLGIKAESEEPLRDLIKPVVFATIPLFSNGVITASFQMSLVFTVEGTIDIVGTIVTRETFFWSEHSTKKTDSRDTYGFKVSAAVKFGVALKPAIVITVGMTERMSIDVAELSVSIGVEVTAKGDTSTLGCVDVEFNGVIKVELKIGLLRASSKKMESDLSFGGEILKVEFPILSTHWESSLDAFTDHCTREDHMVRVRFIPGNGYEMPSQVVNTGDKITKPEDPVRYRFVFTGWFVDGDMSKPWDFDNDVAPDVSIITLVGKWGPAPTSPEPYVDPAHPLSPDEAASLAYLVYRTINTNEIEIAGISGNPVSLSIPPQIHGAPVKSIGEEAFRDCTSLTSVKIPNSVISIGSSAFAGCKGLTSVNIPNGVTSIADGTFRICESLTSVSIPDSVTSIGSLAFAACKGLTSINIPNGVTSIGGFAFASCSGLTSIDIPNGVTFIDERAFAYCSGLTSIDIPNSVTSIADYAFWDCTSLKSINIPSGVTSIGNFAFSNCTNLTNVNISSGVTSIGDRAFQYCTNLTSINIPNSVNYIGDFAFTDCASITSVNIPTGVTTISPAAFWGCASLTSVSIPSSVTTIGGAAFCRCTNLTSVSIPDSVTTIVGSTQFFGCDSLRWLYTHQGSRAESHFKQYHPSVGIRYITATSRSVYYDSRGGTAVFGAPAAPGELLTAPQAPVRADYIFAGWYKDANCTMPWRFAIDTMPSNDLTLYAGWTYNPSGFSYAAEGGGVRVLGYNGSLSDLIIPATLGGRPVVAIGDGAIGGSIISVSLPASVNSIDAGAFKFAYTLESIAVAAGSAAYKAQDGVLYTKDGKTLVKYPSARPGETFAVPEGVTTIGTNAIVDAVSLVTLTLPSSLTTLKPRAIYRCESLTSITFSKDPKNIAPAAAKEDSVKAASGALLLCGSRNAPLIIRGPLVAPTLAAYADENYLYYNLRAVTYMLDGEKVITVDTRAGEKLAAPPKPESGEMSLAGWSLTENGELWDFGTDVMPDNDITLYGVWKYDFSYEAVSGGVRLLSYVGDQTRIRVPGAIDGLPVKSIAPGAFAGVPGAVLIADKGGVAQSYALANNLAFEPLTYALTFNTNGGTHVPPRALSAADLIAEPSPQPTRDNHTFTGWYSDAGLTALWNFATGVMPAGDLTLYAGWTKIDASIPNIAFTCQTVSGGVEITGYAGAGGSLEIPASINGVPVVGIAPYAFADNHVILSLGIPASVAYIGDSAFSGSRLGSVTLSGGLTAIGDNAFADCVELDAIAIPNTVATIGDNAFSGCASLLSISLPSSLKKLSRGVLSYCPNISSITFPSGLEAIEESALAYNTRITSVSIGASVNEIDAGALRGCSNLSSITVNSGNMYYKSQDGVLLSRDGTSLYIYPEGKRDTEYAIPAGVGTIEPASMRSSRFETLGIPASLTSIGEDALRASRALKSLTIPATVTTIGPDALPMGVMVYGTRNTAAHRYAAANGLRFIDTAGGDIPVTGIAIPETLNIPLGESRALTAALTPSNTTESGVTWKSADTSVATVDRNGNVSGIYEGTTTITATAENGSRAVCAVTVAGLIEVSGITLSESAIEFSYLYSKRITASILPSDASYKFVTWASSDEAVATVTDGLISAKANGTATITATASNGMTASCPVTVNAPPTLTLPASLKTIAAEAFSGSAAQAVRCPDGLESIGSLAFSNCAELLMLIIPASVTYIAPDALLNSPNVTIYCPENSPAHTYAIDNLIPYEII